MRLMIPDLVDDAMRWHDDVNKFIYHFYMMTYMRVFTLFLWVLLVFYSDDYVATRPIWTDLEKGHIWA